MDLPFPSEIYPYTIRHVGMTLVNIFPYTKFHYCNYPWKVARFPKDWCPAARLKRMEENYNRRGMRTTVEGILLAHHRGIPHILLLQNGAVHKLPGGCLKPGEDEIEGLKRKLTSKLGCFLSRHRPDWQIGPCVTTWRRPNFDSELDLDPSVSDPKECKKLFIVYMADGMHIAKPAGLKLVFVPCFFILKHPDLFDRVISQIPRQLFQTWFILYKYHMT